MQINWLEPLYAKFKVTGTAWVYGRWYDYWDALDCQHFAMYRDNLLLLLNRPKGANTLLMITIGCLEDPSRVNVHMLQKKFMQKEWRIRNRTSPELATDITDRNETPYEWFKHLK